MTGSAGDTWRAVASRNHRGADYAVAYAERFDRLVATDDGVHGEADLVASLLAGSGRVLDAGCGTGRVAARLAALGHDVTGVDVDATMVEQARLRWPELDWRVADLATLEAPDPAYDVVVLAGNVVPFIEPADLTATMAALAMQLVPGGTLVAGFGTDRAHLPPGSPLLPLSAYDEACVGAGLELVARHAGWGREAWPDDPDADPGYAVSLHRR